MRCWRGAAGRRHGRPGRPCPIFPRVEAGGPGLSRRRVPERLPGLVDSHAHLQHARFDADRDDGDRPRRRGGHRADLRPGLGRAVVGGRARPREPASRTSSTRRVGVHPHHAAEMDEARMGAARGAGRRQPRRERSGRSASTSTATCRRRKCSARPSRASSRSPRARDLPVLVHDRERARGDRGGAACAGAVAACFTPSAATRRWRGASSSAGFVVSFALPVAFGSATGPRAAAAALPDGAFLVETDSPYLGPDAAGRNEPTTALRVVAELGRLRGVDPEALVAPIRAAYERAHRSSLAGERLFERWHAGCN